MKFIVTRCAAAVVSIGAILIVTAEPTRATTATAGQKCAIAKIHAVARNTTAQLNCLTKLVMDPDFDFDTCVESAATAASDSFAKAEARAVKGGGCVTTADDEDLEFEVEDFVDSIDSDLPSE